MSLICLVACYCEGRMLDMKSLMLNLWRMITVNKTARVKKIVVWVQQRRTWHFYWTCMNTAAFVLFCAQWFFLCSFFSKFNHDSATVLKHYIQERTTCTMKELLSAGEEKGIITITFGKNVTYIVLLHLHDKMLVSHKLDSSPRLNFNFTMQHATVSPLTLMTQVACMVFTAHLQKMHIQEIFVQNIQFLNSFAFSVSYSSG